MTDTRVTHPPHPPFPAHHVHFEPLRWIGAYKLLKAALAIFGGLMLLRLAHRDLPEVASEWMERLRISEDSALGQFIAHRVLLIHAKSLSLVAAWLFGYSVLGAIEGVGLIMRKTWAEWLTVVTTAALVPVEVYEFAKRFTWVRLTILLLNVAVVIYLVWRLRSDRRKKNIAQIEAAAGSI